MQATRINRGADDLNHWNPDLTWYIECRQVPKYVKCVRYFFKGVLFKNCLNFYKNCLNFYINCMHFYNNKMRVLLKIVCVFYTKTVYTILFSYTYKVLLRFRPSNIKMLSTRLLVPCNLCLIIPSLTISLIQDNNYNIYLKYNIQCI